MKRIAVIAAAIAMFASTAAIALADDATEATEGETRTERVLRDTQMWKVNILADYWMRGEEAVDESPEGEASEPTNGEEAVAEPSIEDEIEMLRTGEIVVGWGAMFKLMQLAKLYYPEMSLTEVASMIKGEDEGWAFGRRFKEPRAGSDEVESDDDSPKNLGQLKKQYREENGSHGKKPKRP